MRHARAAVIASTRRPRIHFGHPPSRTNSPLEKIATGYLKRNSNICTNREPYIAVSARLSVRHAVHDVIEAHTKGHGSETLGIFGHVGPLPRVAEVHVVANGH